MVKYNGKWYEKHEAWNIMDELRAKLQKKKVYEFEYSYLRYNPQLGTSERTSTVLACTAAEAERKAKKSCNDYNAYGSLEFTRLTGTKKLLENNVDYRWEVEIEEHLSGDKIVKKLEKLYRH